MFDAFIAGLISIFKLKTFMYMSIGAGIGFWVGILPGLGGGTTMALMLPFIYRMSPEEAFPFLLGMHSVVTTTGDITSVLFGIPGEPTTVATVVDGHAMAKKGEGGRALGAALTSSLIGAIIGAFFLALSVPVIRPIILSFGTPELFMVVILGLTSIAVLSSQSYRGFLLGLMSGGLGLLFSLVGQDPQAGIFRFTFGNIYFSEGLPIIPMVVGIFAIPEIIELMIKRTAIAETIPATNIQSGVIQGVKDTFKYFWLTARCSLIGTFFGMLPGLGGGVAQWAAYAHAMQSAKTPEDRARFGKGDVRGVLGPGAANNAKEGGNLIPTIAFGVPAGPGMAILLGGFLLMGLVPGPEMLTTHVSLTFSMVWTIVITNIIVVIISLIFIQKLADLTLVRGSLIIPFLILLTFIGGYATNANINDIYVMLFAGGIGYVMMRFNWSRPPFILGFILGNMAESYLFTSVQRFGLEWLYRPGVLFIFFLCVLVAVYPTIQNYLYKRRLLKEQVHEV